MERRVNKRLHGNRWKADYLPVMIGRMNTLTIDLDDSAAHLVQQAARAANQPVVEWVRHSICEAAARSMKGVPNDVRANRVSPLHPEALQPAVDFNAPLEEFAPYV
jgi:hypothetical protein